MHWSVLCWVCFLEWARWLRTMVFFQFLNISDVSFQFFDEYYKNVEFTFNRCFVESWVGINSVALLSGWKPASMCAASTLAWKTDSIKEEPSCGFNEFVLLNMRCACPLWIVYAQLTKPAAFVVLSLLSMAHLLKGWCGVRRCWVLPNPMEGQAKGLNLLCRTSPALLRDHGQPQCVAHLW